MAFSRMTKNVKNVSMLPDAVQGQSNELKNTFDQAGVDLKDALNKLIDELEANTSASNLGAFKNNVNTTVQEYLDSMNTKLSTVEEGANAYTLPEATDEILGGIRVGATTEIVNGKLEAKGLPAPDDVAREAIFSHAANETIHLTADEKVAIRELEEVSEDLLTSVDTGVSGVINVGAIAKFTITPDMVGKRIVCTSATNSRWLVLPKPSEVGKGAIIEIMNDIPVANDFGSVFIEIETIEGNIKKGNISDTKCIQPGNTVRRYYCDGTKWITNIEKVIFNTYVKFVLAGTSSDISPVYGWSGGYRQFANPSQLKHFLEYKNILVGLGGTFTLDSNLFFEDCELKICGNYQAGCLIIPNDYTITLRNCSLSLSRMTLQIDGIAFNCSGKMGVILGDQHGVTIKAISDTGFTLIRFHNSDAYNTTPVTGLNLSLCCCNFSNDFAGTSKILHTNYAHSISPILIDRSATAGWGKKPDNVMWHNASDTLSRIGTSGLYTVG